MKREFEDRRWLARVLSPGGDIKGAAWLVDGCHLITCAHVVEDAGVSPGGTITVEFPLQDDAAPRQATVLEAGWLPSAGTAGDISVLEVHDMPAGAQGLPLRARRSLRGQAFEAYGFPPGYDDSVNVGGTLGVAVGRQWVQVEATSGLAVEPGFSGGAVWSDELGAAVAMLVTRDTGTGGRVAFAVPVSVIATVHPLVTQALPTALELDPDRDTHWRARARGTQQPGAARSLFTGRRRALSELSTWLGDDATQRRLRVVTGGPGTGKSAVLARLLTLADAHERSTMPDIETDDDAVPPAGSVDVTLSARAHTAAQVAHHMADVLDLEVADATALPAALAELVKQEDRTLVVVADALDEAAEPWRVCQLLISCASAGCRVLVGCRPHLVADLTDPEPMDLGQAPWLEPGDVADYVRRLLVASGVGDEAGLVAEIETAAAGNFLVAQLTAQAVAVGGRPDGPLPTTVRAAFDTYLDALGDERERVRDLLIPLAYAFGDGLAGDDLWLAAVETLSRPYVQGDLNKTLTGAGGAFLTVHTTSAEEVPRYRLFHQALADSLLAAQPDPPAADHGRLLDAWSRFVPERDGHEHWTGAHPYLQAHAADHAAAAGRLGEFCDQHLGWLAVGDLHRLAGHLHACPDAHPDLAATLGLAAGRANPLAPDGRGTILAVASAHLGLGDNLIKLTDALQPAYVPRWAHRLGAAHRIFSGHESGVRSVAVAHIDGAVRIVSGGDDGTVRVWDPARGAQVGEPLRGHDGWVNSVAVAHIDGAARIVSGGNDGTVRVWDPARGAQVGDPLRGHQGWVNSVAVNSVAVAHIDGAARIVSGGDDGTVRVWDPTRGAQVGDPLRGHEGRVNSVAVAHIDGAARIVSGGDDGTVRVWDPTRGAQVGDPLRGHEGGVNSVAVAHIDGATRIVSGGNDATMRVWDPARGARVGEPLRGHEGWVSSVAVAHIDGATRIVSGSGDGTVRVWDPARGARVGEPLRGHESWVNSVAVAHIDGASRIVSGGEDGTVRVWDPAGGAQVGEPLRCHQGRVNSVAVAHIDGASRIVSGGEDGTVRVWDSAGGAQVGEPLRGHEGGVSSVAVAHIDGAARIVSGGNDATVRVWDPARGAQVGEPLRGHEGWVSSVAVGHIDGATRIVSGSGEVWVWDPARGAQVGEPLRGHEGGVHSVAVGHIDGATRIVSGRHDGTVRVWDPARGAQVGEPLRGHEGAVYSVAVAHIDGATRIVSGSGDGTVRVWDPARGAQVGEPLRGHEGAVYSVAVAHIDGATRIVSGSGDGTVRVWDLSDTRLVSCLNLLAAVSAVACGGEREVYVAAHAALCRFDIRRDLRTGKPA